jgi:hypothetical protein
MATWVGWECSAATTRDARLEGKWRFMNIFVGSGICRTGDTPAKAGVGPRR